MTLACDCCFGNRAVLRRLQNQVSEAVRTPIVLLGQHVRVDRQRDEARCYLHGNEHAPQGWYAKAGRVIKLSKPFRMPTGNLIRMSAPRGF
jgi:hypothetical protein